MDCRSARYLRHERALSRCQGRGNVQPVRDKKRAALWCAGVGGVLVLSAVVLGVVNLTVWDASVVGAAFANVVIGLGGLLVVLGVGLASGSGVALRMWVAPSDRRSPTALPHPAAHR